MASHLRLPALATAALSLGLNIAIIGCAGRTLNIYLTQQQDNAYFLPVWASHFDMRGLPALIGTSAVIIVLNVLLMTALFISALPANLIVLASGALSTIMAIIAISFSAALNNGAGDTLQTWTCMWRDVADENVPRQFDTLCHETRFAFYTTIPSLILQLMLLGLGLYAIAGGSGGKKRGVRLDEEEKDHHELTQRRAGPSLDTKSESPRSLLDSMRIMAGKH